MLESFKNINDYIRDNLEPNNLQIPEEKINDENKRRKTGSFYLGNKLIYRQNDTGNNLGSLRLPPESIAIYNLLQSYNFGSNIVYPAISTIRKQILISNENIKDHLLFLQDLGLISIIEEINKNGGRNKFKYILYEFIKEDIPVLQKRVPIALSNLKNLKKERSLLKKKRTVQTNKNQPSAMNENSGNIGHAELDKFRHPERDKFGHTEENNNNSNKNNSKYSYSKDKKFMNKKYSPIINYNPIPQESELDQNLANLAKKCPEFNKEFNEFCEEDTTDYREKAFYWIMHHAGNHLLSLGDVVNSIKSTSAKRDNGSLMYSPMSYLIGVMQKKSHNREIGIEAPGKAKVYQMYEYLKNRIGEESHNFKEYVIDHENGELRFTVRDPADSEILYDYCTLITADVNKRFGTSIIPALSY